MERLPLHEAADFDRNGSPLTSRHRADKSNAVQADSKPPYPIRIAFSLSLSGGLLQFDLIALDSSTFVLCVLLKTRMSVWVGMPWEDDPAPVRTHYRGPSLYQDNRWIRVASMRVPFEGPFRALARGGGLYLISDAGAAYTVPGVLEPGPPAAEDPPPIIPKFPSVSLTMERDLGERFFGEPDTELRPVEGLESVELVVDDKDLDELFFFTPGAIVSAGGVRTPLAGKTAPVPETARGPMRTMLQHLPALQAARAAAHREPGPP